MTTQYTPILKLALPVTGELDGTWGDVVNDNITSMVEQAVAGLATINSWTANSHTLTTANGTTSEARCAMLVAATGGGAPTAAAEIICPAASKLYILKNTTGYTVTLKTAAGSGVAVPNGDTAFLFCDGTNVNACITTVTFANGTANGVAYLNASKVLTSGSGLTYDGTALTMGANPTLSAGTANGILYLNGSKVATSGSALTFDGTNVSNTGRYIVNAAGSVAGIADISLGALSGGAWLNTPSGKPGYLAIAGSASFLWDSNNLISYIGGAEQMRLTSTGLGIGTSSPGTKLDVQGSVPFARVKDNSTGYLGFRSENNSGNFYFGIDSSTGGFYGSAYARVLYSDGAYPMVFYTNATERMRLDSSGNLGIGTSSPAYKLDVSGTSRFSGAIGVGTTPGNYGGQIDIYTNANSANNGIWVRNDNAGSSAKAGIVLNASGNSWRMSMGSAANNSNALTWEKDIGGAPITLMTLDSSGNLGLGVTPSAWSGYGAPVLEMPSGGTVMGQGSTSIGANFYYSGGAFRYTVNYTASYYNQNTGAHYWFTAPSGTAGNAISFTQAMTLTAAGKLFVGTATDNANARVHFAGTAQSDNGINLSYFGVGSALIRIADGNNLTFGLDSAAGNTERMRLDSSGNLGLGVTPSATASPYKSIELFGAYWMGGNNTTPASYSYTNAYFDGSDKYKTSGFAASLYRQLNGTHSWHTAPSGTAGNAISFTQAMTLDASGNLGVGLTSPVGRITIKGQSSATALQQLAFQYHGSASNYLAIGLQNVTGQAQIMAGSGASLIFYTNSDLSSTNERARITYVGNQIDYQPAESAQNTSVTLTAANLQAQIITSNAAVTLTLPTGTSLEDYTSGMATDTAFEVTFIATTANAITIGANGNTTVGNLTVSGNTSGTFRFRKTATNTFTVYRIS